MLIGGGLTEEQIVVGSWPVLWEGSGWVESPLVSSRLGVYVAFCTDMPEEPHR